MIVSEKVFGLVTSEAELAAALAHQVAHEIDNDFARFWRMYKAGEPAEGTKEWRAEVEGTEERADELGARMMYAAGWDPNAMVVLLEEMFDRQIEIGTIMEASALTRVSGTRVEKLRALVKQLPRKQGLVETSELFAKFEERFWADGAGAEALRKKQDAATSPESLAFVGEEFDDLPVEPTIEEQVAFAKRRLERLKAREPTLDSNRELVAYFSRIVDRLVEHAPKKPPFELTVHVSSLPTTNAMASLGGAIIVYERFLHAADTEAEIVTVLAHEVAHLVHNDPLATWRSYRESHRARFFYRDQRERRADEDGIRMMHAAGWDPSGVPEYFRRLNLRLRHPPAGGHRLQGMFRSKDRLEELEALIESLPPKPDAVEDSEEFRRLKERR
jgi:predicted Zn-dependent protease